MSVRLHVLLGQGGVGKTTLASAYGVALTRHGRRVGLLGVDPAGRVRDALGMTAIAEQPGDVPGAAGLKAALLVPGETLRRWAAEELGGIEQREPLLRNPFFLALADRLAGATDAFAAVRLAEWAETDPQLDDLIVDTAPGLHGLEFLARPERLLSVLQGRVLRWLSAAASAGVTEREGRRILRALARIAGNGILVELAEFFVLMERIAARMVTRLERAREWLRDTSTEMLLVCVPGPGAASGAQLLSAQLSALGLPRGPLVLNRALPRSLLTLELEDSTDESRAFRRFVRASAALQEETARELARSFRVVEVPVGSGLDAAGAAQVAALAALGEELMRALGC